MHCFNFIDLLAYKPWKFFEFLVNIILEILKIIMILFSKLCKEKSLKVCQNNIIREETL